MCFDSLDLLRCDSNLFDFIFFFGVTLIINRKIIPYYNLAMKLRSLKILLKGVILTGIFYSFCLSCSNPQPIPKGKEAFEGVWQASSGFKVNIKASGTADVYEHNLLLNSDNMKLIIGITPEYATDMLVGFRDDSVLIIRKPTVRAREYRINRNPYMDGDTMKMVLNGVVLIKQK